MAGPAFTHDSLIQAFERRFDHFSARAVAAEVLEGAGLKKSDAYDAAALARIAQVIEKIVARPGVILGSFAPVAEEKPAAKGEEKAAPKGEEKAAPKGEEKAAPKGEEKAAPKAEPKTDEPAPEAAEAAAAPEAEEKPVEKKADKKK
jgi:hypothetical protein